MARQNKEAVRSGLIASAITQNPVDIDYETFNAAADTVNGVAVPKNIDTGFYYYATHNMDDPEIAAVLYD